MRVLHQKVAQLTQKFLKKNVRFDLPLDILGYNFIKFNFYEKSI